MHAGERRPPPRIVVYRFSGHGSWSQGLGMEDKESPKGALAVSVWVAGHDDKPPRCHFRPYTEHRVAQARWPFSASLPLSLKRTSTLSMAGWRTGTLPMAFPWLHVASVRYAGVCASMMTILSPGSALADRPRSRLSALWGGLRAACAGRAQRI